MSGSVKETLMRQWSMLQMIPASKKISTRELKSQLAEQGFETDIRTIQRDLNNLSAGIFPLICDNREKPYGWSWAKGAKILSIPSMEIHTALSLLVADQFAEHLLPPRTLDFLAPYIALSSLVVGRL